VNRSAPAIEIRKGKTSMKDKDSFGPRQVEAILAGLHPDGKPRWGMMTPQHIVEHLTIGVKASVGKTKPMVVSTPEQIVQLKKQLLESPDPWPRNMKNPLLPAEGLPALKYGSLEEAKEKLIGAVAEFEAYYTAHPDAVQPNPFLGYLNGSDWRQFHFKHFTHHFTQYGLL
jgi:oxepin-CoA hydrolase/3-oxo-5,6-dehydrosuberyl-CoA semialdehyde dehydrogenase